MVTAHDGARALAQAEETPPAPAIVDLEMPGTHGLDVIRKVKGMFGPAVHIIVRTGHDDGVSHAEAFEAGTHDFVVKPTEMSELKRGVGLYFYRLVAEAMGEGSIMSRPRSVPASSCGCPAVPDAFGCRPARRGLG